MRAIVAVAVLIVALGSAATLLLLPEDAESSAAGQPGVAEQLHYLGRDPLTGLATTVGDRFIAEMQQSFETYYVEDAEPVPPPPAEGADVARIEIPALGISANVGRFGLDAAGRLDVPQDASTIGWNPAYSDLPGEGGATFFAAHFEYQGIPGVFFGLSDLVAGSDVLVTLSDGSVRTYRVTSTIDYDLASIDMGAILAGREGVESITLMTCSGPGDGGRYPMRTVVLAERADG